MKEKESEFNQFRLKQAEKKTIQLKNNILYSGECDWPFKIRIFGITDINRIFLLDDKDSKFFTLNERRRATYNGYSDGRIFFIGLCPP
jgi:hypothetical protein